MHQLIRSPFEEQSPVAVFVQRQIALKEKAKISGIRNKSHDYYK